MGYLLSHLNREKGKKNPYFKIAHSAIIGHNAIALPVFVFSTDFLNLRYCSYDETRDLGKLKLDKMDISASIWASGCSLQSEIWDEKRVAADVWSATLKSKAVNSAQMCSASMKWLKRTNKTNMDHTPSCESNKSDATEVVLLTSNLACPFLGLGNGFY